LAGKICELPYDVLSSEEARESAAGNPLSFFHVSKPEIDLPPGTNAHAPEVYAKGAENFQKLVSQGALEADTSPNFYLYRQVMDGRSQTGIVATAACDEYLGGVIQKHELTRVDKEDDRVRHIEALNCQTGPAFLAYRGQALERFVADRTSGAPAADFTAKDGVRHTSWVISDPADIGFIEAAFAEIPRLYIADGHHRSAAAARVHQSRRGAGGSGRFLAVIFSHAQLQILAYNRVLKDLNGNTPDEFLKKLERVFTVTDAESASPRRKHELGFYWQGRWRTLGFREKLLETQDPLERLDVELLQRHVLSPVFGIENPRTSHRIHFVGGVRGEGELERLVRGGNFECAFAMYPTAMEDMMAVADAGEIMPPKSTWFEPKLRDGMFCHLI
jgi:uncharacterized protein (DUF1015 family)